MINDLKSFATSVRKWSRHLTDFPTDRFQTHDWQVQCRSVLKEIYSHLCLTDEYVKTALVDTGPRPFVLKCSTPWGGGDYVTFLACTGLLSVRFSSRHMWIWRQGD